jgi:hypothetical protein
MIYSPFLERLTETINSLRWILFDMIVAVANAVTVGAAKRTTLADLRARVNDHARMAKPYVASCASDIDFA